METFPLTENTPLSWNLPLFASSQPAASILKLSVCVGGRNVLALVSGKNSSREF